jgi:hypothetical protein
MAFNLSTMFIEFTTQGWEDVDEKIKASIEETKRLEGQMQKFGQMAKTVFQWASMGIMGFVTAGFMGTTQGELFHESMRELSNEIASVFLPIMQMATDMVRGLTDWFRNLSGGTQDGIMVIVAIAGVMGVMTAVIIKVAGAIATLVLGLKAFVLWMGFVHVSTGGLLLALGAIVAVLVAIGAAIAAAFGAFDSKKDSAHRTVTRTGGGMEDVQATYHRLQQTALKMDVGRSDSQILESIDKNTAGTKRAVEQKPPAVGR